MKRLRKSILLTVALLIFTTWLIGCFPVAFLQPPFGDEDVFFEPSLIGKWVMVQPWLGEREPDSYECIGAGNGSSYRVLIKDDEGRKVSLLAHLGKIEGKIYLVATLALDVESLHPVEFLFVLPQHFFIFRVEQIRPQLKLIPLAHDACIELLKEKPTAVPHVTYKRGGDDILLITANPAEFRQFIKEYGDSAELFLQDKAIVFNEEEWRILYADPASGVTWHYEPNRIFRWEGGAKLWIWRTGDKEDLLKHLRDIGEPEATLISIQHDYAYTTYLVYVRCKDRSISYNASRYYNSAGTIIASSHSIEEHVAPIEPGSFGERLAQLICPQFGR